MNPPPEVPEGGEEGLHVDTTVFRFPCRALEKKFRTEGEEGPSARNNYIAVGLGCQAGLINNSSA